MELKIAEAERKLKEEEDGACNPGRVAFLKMKIAELKLEQEEDGACNPVRVAFLKTKIAELKLEQEELSPTRDESRIITLKANFDKLEKKMKVEQEHNAKLSKSEIDMVEVDKGA